MTYASGCSTIAARAPDASDGKGDAYDNAPMMSVSSASQIMRCVRRRPDKKGRAPICCRGSRVSTTITMASEGHAGRAAGLRAFREISPVMYRYCTNGAASTRRAIASSVTSPARWRVLNCGSSTGGGPGSPATISGNAAEGVSSHPKDWRRSSSTNWWSDGPTCARREVRPGMTSSGMAKSSIFSASTLPGEATGTPADTSRTAVASSSRLSTGAIATAASTRRRNELVAFRRCTCHSCSQAGGSGSASPRKTTRRRGPARRSMWAAIRLSCSATARSSFETLSKTNGGPSSTTRSSVTAILKMRWQVTAKWKKSAFPVRASSRTTSRTASSGSASMPRSITPTPSPTHAPHDLAAAAAVPPPRAPTHSAGLLQRAPFPIWLPRAAVEAASPGCPWKSETQPLYHPLEGHVDGAAWPSILARVDGGWAIAHPQATAECKLRRRCPGRAARVPPRFFAAPPSHCLHIPVPEYPDQALVGAPPHTRHYTPGRHRKRKRSGAGHGAEDGARPTQIEAGRQARSAGIPVTWCVTYACFHRLFARLSTGASRDPIAGRRGEGWWGNLHGANATARPRAAYFVAHAAVCTHRGTMWARPGSIACPSRQMCGGQRSSGHRTSVRWAPMRPISVDDAAELLFQQGCGWPWWISCYPVRLLLVHTWGATRAARGCEGWWRTVPTRPCPVGERWQHCPARDCTTTQLSWEADPGRSRWRAWVAPSPHPRRRVRQPRLLKTHQREGGCRRTQPPPRPLSHTLDTVGASKVPWFCSGPTRSRTPVRLYPRPAAVLLPSPPLSPGGKRPLQTSSHAYAHASSPHRCLPVRQHSSAAPQ